MGDAFGNLSNAQTDAWIDGLRMMDDEAFFATIITMMELHSQPQGSIIEKAEQDAAAQQMDKVFLERQANEYEVAVSDRARNLIRRIQNLYAIAFVRILEKNEREKRGIYGGRIVQRPIQGGQAMSQQEILSYLVGGRKALRKAGRRSARRSRRSRSALRRSRSVRRNVRRSKGRKI